ncbi:hypothetical protein OHT76_42595 [Streptomyces sp. NBC_00287]|uniref:hypothetical protein n=1 Tax=Streptomyces sp. NBC_00287 TaxID=2975702 RepID=UPI002E2E7A22|nr:hypothetical protein [Streptomyces sp. NBC_00287]
MSRAIGRRRWAVALIAIGLTACGSEDDRGAPKATVSRGAQHEARVLSQQQLEDAVVDAHDLPGVQVDEIGAGTDGLGDGVIRAARRTDTAPAVCAPVSAAVDGASGYTPVGSVQRVAGTTGLPALLTLVSYRSANVSRVMQELRAGLKSCKGYEVGEGAMKVTYDDVASTAVPSQGDEGVAFRLKWVVEPGEDGLTSPISVAVIRHGSTLAIYKAVSHRSGAAASIPRDLVSAQSHVLDAAVQPTA